MLFSSSRDMKQPSERSSLLPVGAAVVSDSKRVKETGGGRVMYSRS